jgi:hypothetical protein
MIVFWHTYLQSVPPARSCWHLPLTTNPIHPTFPPNRITFEGNPKDLVAGISCAFFEAPTAQERWRALASGARRFV